MMIRNIFCLIMSLFIVVSTTVNANAASSWNVNSAKSVGSRVIIGATNGGYKSAVNIAPNLLKIARTLVKTGNAASLAIAVAGLIGDGVDYVLDPANNSVKYKDPAFTGGLLWRAGAVPSAVANYYDDPGAACADGLKMLPNLRGYTYTGYRLSSGEWGDCLGKDPNGSPLILYSVVREKVDSKLIDVPVPDIASNVVSKAQAGDAQSQKILRDVATAAVIAGDYDADLLSGAVPINDYSKPVIPAIPGAQVGDVDTGMTGGDVGASAQDALDRAEEARKQASAAADAASAAADAARAAADAAKDLINQAVDQAIKDAAQANAAQAAKDAADAQKVADAAAAEAAKIADEAAAKAEKAAAAQNAKVADAQKALDAAKATGDNAKISDAQIALDRAKAEAVAADAAATKAKEKAAAAKKRAEPKPFELPAFCSWATVVCDLAEWMKKEPVIDESDGDIPVATQDESMHVGILEKLYVSMPAQCPPDPVFEFMGGRVVFPIDVFCKFAVMMKPLVLLFAYIKGLSVIGNGLS